MHNAFPAVLADVHRRVVFVVISQRRGDPGAEGQVALMLRVVQQPEGAAEHGVADAFGTVIPGAAHSQAAEGNDDLRRGEHRSPLDVMHRAQRGDIAVQAESGGVLLVAVQIDVVAFRVAVVEQCQVGAGREGDVVPWVGGDDPGIGGHAAQAEQVRDQSPEEIVRMVGARRGFDSVVCALVIHCRDSLSVHWLFRENPRATELAVKYRGVRVIALVLHQLMQLATAHSHVSTVEEGEGQGVLQQTG
ncbi:hypothetical protein D9M71_176480 [compost metagenome]